MIPHDANGSEVYAVPKFYCTRCKDQIAPQFDDDYVSGYCECGSHWFIPHFKVPAYVLTSQQIANSPGQPPRSGHQDDTNAGLDHEAAQRDVPDDADASADGAGPGDGAQGRVRKTRRSAKD